jgi:hypothetical protein
VTTSILVWIVKEVNEVFNRPVSEKRHIEKEVKKLLSPV